ncbi:hypothetical protein ACIBPB_32320 [Micromonospora sp. NPDC049836]|uniref:hypothetical protein n=1 Tax=Micromonospora sp. NPDC049836 TaxID=3364274 RepID=UPI0037B2FBF2
MSLSPIGADALASAVRDELTAAGLPVLPAEPAEVPGSGASIQADADDLGVWVRWLSSDALRDAASRALQAGAYRPDGSEVHPALRHASVVTDAMLTALAQILQAAGFQVQTDADDMRAGELLVLGRQSGPTWRDPVTPPLAGSSAYMPGVRVRLIEGDHAGTVTTVTGARWRNWPATGPPDGYRVEHPDGAGELDVPSTAVTLADPAEGQRRNPPAAPSRGRAQPRNPPRS